MHILILQNNAQSTHMLEHSLKENGYLVEIVHDGREGLHRAIERAYDVIILGVALSNMNGFEIVKTLREQGVGAPVLMLAESNSIPDVIRGLDSGADDYMTKPFNMAELCARLRALNRRRGGMFPETMESYDLNLSFKDHCLVCGEKIIHLSNRELALMRILMANSGQVVSSETIIDEIWGVGSNANHNNIEAYVSLLRKKIRILESHSCIETIRKTGYCLTKSNKEI